jgi:hypothetical protein
VIINSNYIPLLTYPVPPHLSTDRSAGKKLAHWDESSSQKDSNGISSERKNFQAKENNKLVSELILFLIDS